MVAKTHTASRARAPMQTRRPAPRSAVPSHYEYYLDLLARHAARRR